MLTECPSCQTVFRVTGAILKMGHGQVRCGKCRKQFDAIECMLDDEDVETPVKPSPTKADSEAPLRNFEGPTYAEEVTMEGSRIEISGTYRMPDTDGPRQEKIVRERVVIDNDDLSPTSSHHADGQAEHEIDDVLGDTMDEAVVDEAGEAELDINSDDGEPVADAADHLLNDVSERGHSNPGSSREASAVPNRWRRALHIGRKKEREKIHAELHALTQAERPRVLRAGVWVAICMLLVSVLAIQVMHHNRDFLVRDARFGNTISRLYRLVGLSPTPHWDLAAYQWDIYKVGLDPKIPDALRVVGSVVNNAVFAQPYPLGKLSLKDRWESPVGVRAFEPYEYLPSPEAADRLMAPKQRANIEIVIADPGADAVGYLIHACLEQDRQLTCADDFPARR